VNDKALALVKKLKVTPEDNDTSKALNKQAADKRAERRLRQSLHRKRGRLSQDSQ
jgi:hypothetical protein